VSVVPDPAEQFLLTGPAGLLGALVGVFVADPDIELVSVSGPPERPDLLVARTTPDRADLLRRALGEQLVVELDRPLHPAAPHPEPPPDPSGGP
jgi:hypothetical protein